MKTNKQIVDGLAAELNNANLQALDYRLRIDNLKTKVLLGILAVAIISVITTATGVKYYTTNTNEKNILTSEIKTQMRLVNEMKLVQDEMMENNSFVYVSREELAKDLDTNYPGVSPKTKKLILDTILEESVKYNLNPLILYSLCYVESSFRHWLEHQETIVDINGKKVKIRAVGLTGVVWEIHSKDLILEGIAETRGDLFSPATNIRAGAFVLYKYINMENLKGTTTHTQSGLLRYYGGNVESYNDRIKAKIFDLTKDSYFK